MEGVSPTEGRLQVFGIKADVFWVINQSICVHISRPNEQRSLPLLGISLDLIRPVLLEENVDRSNYIWVSFPPFSAWGAGDDALQAARYECDNLQLPT